MAKHETPLLDQLIGGQWPSFVDDLKQYAEYRAKNPNNEFTGELLAGLELQPEVEELYAGVRNQRDLVFEADGFC